jgi:hypothetical protein
LKYSFVMRTKVPAEEKRVMFRAELAIKVIYVIIE